MKIGVSKLIEHALSDTKNFSVGSYDEIYSFRNEDITFSQRSSEIHKSRDYMKSVLLYVLMYCYPDKLNGNKDTIEMCEKSLINDWLLKISNSMIKIKKGFLPNLLGVSIKKITLLDLSYELVKNYKYQLNTKFDWKKINYVQGEFLFYWEALIRDKIKKGEKNITKEELLNMLRNFKLSILSSKEMKGFKYQ